MVVGEYIVKVDFIHPFCATGMKTLHQRQQYVTQLNLLNQNY